MVVKIGVVCVDFVVVVIRLEQLCPVNHGVQRQKNLSSFVARHVPLFSQVSG